MARPRRPGHGEPIPEEVDQHPQHRQRRHRQRHSEQPPDLAPRGYPQEDEHRVDPDRVPMDPRGQQVPLDHIDPDVNDRRQRRRRRRDDEGERHGRDCRQPGADVRERHRRRPEPEQQRERDVQQPERRRHPLRRDRDQQPAEVARARVLQVPPERVSVVPEPGQRSDSLVLLQQMGVIPS
ncbi:MAG: hypothetical protein M3Q10_03485 [Chloroflexota bacterium]|nr:hypothetical protein [Chloroflexota bacterium]